MEKKTFISKSYTNQNDYIIRLMKFKFYQEFLRVKLTEHQLQELSITTTSIPKIIPCLKTLPAHLMEIMAG